MVWLRAIGIVLALLACGVAGALLYTDNSTPISLALLGRRSPELPVAAWLYAAFLAGIASGLALAGAALLRGAAARRRLRRALAAAEQQRSRSAH